MVENLQIAIVQDCHIELLLKLQKGQISADNTNSGHF